MLGVAAIFLEWTGRSLGQDPATSTDASKQPPKPSVLAPTPPVAPAAVPDSSSSEPSSTEPLERQPYRIILHFGCHPSSRIDEARRSDLLRDWQVLVRRFVGAPWLISIATASSPLLDLDLENPDPASFASVGDYDKVWIIHADRPDLSPGLVFTGREYDVATRRLGPLQRRNVESLANAPRALLESALDLFSPTAVINGQEGGRALLSVRGATIEPASSIGRVVSKGTVFQPVRLIAVEKTKIVVRTIALTYLQVESVEGPIARCNITSAFRDPLTQRVAQANTLAAVGIKPGKSPLRLRFVTTPGNGPAAGYTLTARLVPNGQTRELGVTDRGGRIVLQPGFADGLVILRLLAGNVEPVREIPIMPGESSEERVIPFKPLPLTVALEARVNSLRDEVVDMVALRARLQARMEARLKGEDWTGLDDALKEFGRLTPRDQYAKRLAQLKDEALREQERIKSSILTKTANAQITDLQAMIDRYLDDEPIKAYVAALEDSRADAAAKEKARLKAVARKSTAPPTPALGETKLAEPSPKPQPSNPARAKPVQPAGVAPALPF